MLMYALLSEKFNIGQLFTDKSYAFTYFMLANYRYCTHCYILC